MVFRQDLRKQYILARFSLVAVLVLGILICSTLLTARLSGMVLPCSTEVCGYLEADPLGSGKYLNLPLAGLLVFLALLILVGVGLAGSRPAFRRAKTLSVLGFLLSLLLIAYTVSRYHGFCPWCSASAMCFGGSAWLLLAIPESTSYSHRRAVFAVGAAMGFSLFAGLLYTQVYFVADISRLTASEVYTAANVITTNQPEVVAIISPSCPTCRQLVRSLEARHKGFAVRIAVHDDAYTQTVARVLYRAKDQVARRIVLDELLADTSFTSSAVDLLERQLEKQGLLKEVDRNATMADATLMKKLHVKATPVVLVASGHQWRLASPLETARLAN